MDQMISAPQSAPVDVTMDNFMAVVIEGSKTTPTIVQFWAPWCGPCKQLGPVLEKVVGASGGNAMHVMLLAVNIIFLLGSCWDNSVFISKKLTKMCLLLCL